MLLFHWHVSLLQVELFLLEHDVGRVSLEVNANQYLSLKKIIEKMKIYRQTFPFLFKGLGSL